MPSCCLKLLAICTFYLYIALCIQPTRLRVEYMKNPIGIDVANPRFYWVIDGEGVRGEKQSAYHIIIYDDDTGNIIANTGKITSPDSSHIIISNFTMPSHTHYKWTVQIYGNKSGTASNIESGYFSSGIMDVTEWNDAQYIGIAPTDSPSMNEFRTQFCVNSSFSIKRADAYIIMPGYYKMWLNEELIDDHELGYFTTFELRAYYDMISIKHLINNNGINVIGIMLGNGWYSQSTVNVGVPMIKVMIHIKFENDEEMKFNSNNQDWYQHEGPIRYNDIYQGEWYDATKETEGWLRPNYNYSDWKKASLIKDPVIGTLRSSAIMPIIKKVESYTAVSITQPVLDIWVIDFGQNVAGFCQITIPGNNMKGYNITMIHSEELQKNGLVRNVWPGKDPMMANYTLRGDGNDEVYTPSFTFFGYQYVQIIGFPGVPTEDNIISFFIHTDFDTTTGSVEFGPTNINKPLSNAYIMNSVQHMTRYAAMSNFINIPSDCPTRERHGWLGDGQIAAETLIHNFDMASSYTKWLLDIYDTQIFVNASGQLPDCSPWYNHGAAAPGDPAWTTAYVNIVYWMYHYYGDLRVVLFHYNSLKTFMNSMEKQINASTGTIPIQYSLHGDWDAAYDVTCDHKHRSSMLNTYDWAQQCKFMSILANAIANDDDSKAYIQKYKNAQSAIYNNYFDKNKNIFIDPEETKKDGPIALQSANSFGLYLDILNDTTELQQCVDNLVYDIQVTHNHHIGTGIVGTKAIWPQLCRYEHCDVALNASIQTTMPGYGYWLLEGATTLWEHWQSTKYNTSICGGDPGTKNHIMFGGQGSWYYSGLAGIRPRYANLSNWNEIVIEPYTNSSIFGINIINSQIGTLRGTIIMQTEVYPNNNNNIWQKLKVEIPTGSIAHVVFRRLDAFNKYIPLNEWTITETNIVVWQNMKFVNGDDGVLSGSAIADDAIQFTIESGSYLFQLLTR